MIKFLLQSVLFFTLSTFVFSQAPGNNCATAVAFSLPAVVGNTNTTGSQTTCGTGNGFAAGSYCVNSLYGDGEDGIYSISVPVGGGNYTFTIDGTGTYKILSLHSGCAPTAGNCLNGVSSGAGTTGSFTTNLAAGTYYLIIDTWPSPNCANFILSATFNFVPAVNDDCLGATILTSNTSCSATNGNTSSNYSDSEVGCGTGTEDDDAWYKFVAISGTQTVTVDGGASFDAVLACYTGCDASTNPTGGACVNSTLDDGNETRTLTDLTIGSTYYIKVHDYGVGGSTFAICVTGTPPPVNDECGASATTITPGTPITGTTAGADQDYTWTGQPCTNTGEVWYKFTTPATANCYSLAYDQTVNGCNTVSIWETACPTGAYTDYQANHSTNNFNDQGSNESELAGMLPNTTYYISISNDIDANFTFNIRPNTPLATNDQCSGSNGIGTTAQAADNAVAGCEYSYVSGQDGGIQSTDPSNCDRAQDFPCSTATGFGPLAICALTLENISWYKFTTAAAGDVTITFSGIECNNGGGGFQSGLFTGANCSNLTATGACVAAASGNATYTIPSATAGATYYIAMDGNAGSNCHYNVSGLNVTPLPIELGKFQASLENNNIKLNWNTFSERNNNYFTIEKSKNGTVWEFVKQVKGAGNSSVAKFYSTLDNSPYEGTTYYKLSQTDFDGTTTESSFADVFVKRTEKLELNIYPNPSAGANKTFVTIYNPNIEDIILEVFEIDGKLVDSKIITTHEFNTKLEMKHSFNPGVYFVKATNETGEIDTFKWIVE